MSPDELDAIDAWCAKRLIEYGYTDELPTHSIRSTISSLVAEVRRLRDLAEPEFVILDDYDEIAALPFTGDIEAL